MKILPHLRGRSDGGPLCIAHRGASAHAPENTLAAFVRAAELGADLVEMDIHASADGVPVVVHDADLGRVAGVRGNVYWYRVEELKEFDVGGGERIPTLAEAIECCADLGLGMYLEIKMAFVAALVAGAVRKAGVLDRVVIASFRPDWVAEVRSAEPSLATAVLFGAPNVDAVALARSVGARYVHPGWELAHPEPSRLLEGGWLDRVRAAGLHVVSWHEERPQQIRELARLGVDAICSDDPAAVRQVLDERAR